ncbi:MAG: hypothetical protein QOH58_37 [Thermoleophilaceae bacterium]|jgi:hypothetical protein|nr:hypothetical protein [Thermoleophilaceae bacterium]
MSTPNNRAFSPPETVFLIGVPLLWAVLLLFHPTGDGDEYYPILKDQVTAWQAVHLGMMLFIPLTAGVFLLLLRGVSGPAALVSRIALAVFAVFYGAFEVLMGVGNGILVNEVNALPAAERATGAQLVQDFSENKLLADPGVLTAIGSAALIVAFLAAGIALHRRAGASIAVPILLGLSAPLVAIHVTPFGPVGLALVIAAVLLALRGRAAARLPTFVPQPDPA